MIKMLHLQKKKCRPFVGLSPFLLPLAFYYFEEKSSLYSSLAGTEVAFDSSGRKSLSPTSLKNLLQGCSKNNFVAKHTRGESGDEHILALGGGVGGWDDMVIEHRNRPNIPHI